MDNKSIKKQMILNAFKWRDNIKKKEHEEMCAQALILFMLIITMSNSYHIYNNFDKKLIY